MKQVGGYIFTEEPPAGITPTWEIREGDALERLRELPDGGVRLFLTSPPYKSKFDYGVEGQCGLEDSVDAYVRYQAAVAKEMLRASKKDANLFFIVNDSFNGSGGAGGDFKQDDGYGPHAIRGPREKGWPLKAQLLVPERLRMAFAQVGWIPVLKIVWDKSDARRAAIDRPSYSYEEILAFSREENGLYEEIMLFCASPSHYFNRHAVLAPFSQNSLKQLEKTYSGKARFDHSQTRTEDPSKTKAKMVKSMQGRDGAFLRAVWNIPSGNQPVITMLNGEVVKGVASFPLILAEICVNLGSAPGDLICDPFAGMGTTALAAAKWARNSVGIELSPRFAAAARQRMQDAGF